MHQEFYTASHVINSFARTVTGPDEVELKVRAKTFDLLLLLISRPGEVLSKQQILAECWQNVVVDDAVVVQSIKELRKLFAGLDVIKTLPKQGYSWIAVVSVNTLVPSNVSNEFDTKPPSDTPQHQVAFSVKSLLLGAVALCISLLILVLFSSDSTQNPSNIKGSVLVLPVSSSIDDTHFSWVKLGGMDQMIHRLTSTERYGVLATDYVLEILRRAEAPVTGLSDLDIDRLFKVSGANMVVESEVSGSTGDYKLVYTLHTNSRKQQGVVMSGSLEDAIEQVTEVVSEVLDPNARLNNDEYLSTFANDLMAKGVKALMQHDYQHAETMFKAAIAANANNISAYRLLGKSLVNSGQFTEAEDLLLAGLAKNQTLPAPLETESVRMHFWLAMNAAQQADVNGAKKNFEQARVVAESINDWLFLAYIEESLGKIALSLKDFTLAEQKFELAQRYHGVLQCPYGKATVLLSQSSLAQARGNKEEAQQLINQSLLVAKQRNLTAIVNKAEALLQK
jgi:transcriptional activator of cad operon